MVEANTREAILEATRELLQKIVDANGIKAQDVAAAIFTTTRDLDAEFPAVAAREMGWVEVALLCGHEMSVSDSLPRCLRILVLCNTEKSANEIVHVYIKGTEGLRSRVSPAGG